MNRKTYGRFYKEFIYGSSIWRIRIVWMKDNSFKFELLEKSKKFDKSIFIPVDAYDNPRQAIRDVKEKLAI